MLLIRKLKNLVERVPYGIGRWAAYVPFSVRFGSFYAGMTSEVAESEGWSREQGEAYAVEHFRRVFEYARETFPCYRELYALAGVGDLKIRSLEDIAKVPTIDKAWTRTHFAEFSGADKLNTGGSSGTPTPFWMDKGCWGREWAHFHQMWEQVGYRPTDLKLAIRGKNLGSLPFKYNPVHNEFIINTYLNVKDYADELKKLFQKRDIRWFHGYPSSIYQFILECEAVFPDVGDLFKAVKGLFLSSEFPHPYMVEKFRQYNLPFVSWYGHSEMCILARDLSGFSPEESSTKGGFQNVYHPYVTYGLTEVADGHLVGTSYHNFDMPLIRYDTGDLVEDMSGVKTPHLVSAFAIREGRSGDFIEDRNGKKIPLTALIFGRHHHAFDIADYIQIHQDVAGKAVLYVTLKDKACRPSDALSLFDLSNVQVEFTVEFRDAPIRTGAGKLKLRV